MDMKVITKGIMVIIVLVILVVATTEYVDEQNKKIPSVPVYINFDFSKENYSGDSCVTMYVNATWHGGQPTFHICDNYTVEDIQLFFIGNNTHSANLNITSPEYGSAIEINQTSTFLNITRIYYLGNGKHGAISFSVTNNKPREISTWNETCVFITKNLDLAYSKARTGYYAISQINAYAPEYCDVALVEKFTNYQYIYI